MCSLAVRVLRLWISKDIKTTIETILDKYIACCQGLSLLSYMIVLLLWLRRGCHSLLLDLIFQNQLLHIQIP